MTKLISLVCLALLCHIQTGFAQKEPIKSETIKWRGEGHNSYCLQLSDNSIISVRKTIQTGNLTDYFNIIHFDSDLNVISSGKVTPQNKGAYFIELGTIGEKTFLLSYYSDKKRKKFLAVVQELNLSDYTAGTEFILGEIEMNPDHSYANDDHAIDDQFDVYTHRNPRVYFTGETIKVLTYHSGTNTYEEKHFEEDLSLLKSLEYKKTSSETIQDELDTDIFTVIPSSIKLKPIGENSQAGGYSVYDKETLKANVQGFRYTNEEGKITSEFSYEANPEEVWRESAEFILQTVEKRKTKGKSPLDLDFFFRQAILNPDNTVTFIYEQAIYKMPTDNGTSLSLTSSYHRGVLQTVNVSEDGTINWATVIPKKQSTYARENLLGYRVVQKKDGTLFFTYVNVDPKHPNVLQVASCTSNGELEIVVDYTIPSKMEDVKANHIKHFYDGHFYVTFIESKKDGVLKFEY
jgi:hypothetical protein